jgi:hypothetical protein
MLFKRDVYHVVEVEKTAKLPEMTGDLKESLKTLQHLPAFQYILQRMKVKKAAMENALREGFKLSEGELRYLQAGIFWAGELERDIQLLIKDSVPTRPATVDETEEFRRVNRQLELIG